MIFWVVVAGSPAGSRGGLMVRPTSTATMIAISTTSVMATSTGVV